MTLDPSVAFVLGALLSGILLWSVALILTLYDGRNK